MTTNTTVDIDDFLYDFDDDEYILQSNYMKYVNYVISLTIILIILNCVLSFVILSTTTLQDDKYAYIMALLSLAPPIWLLFIVFILFTVFGFSYYSRLLGTSMIGLSLLAITSIVLAILYLQHNTNDLTFGLTISMIITNAIILTVLFISPIYRAYRGSITRYNYQTVTQKTY